VEEDKGNKSGSKEEPSLGYLIAVLVGIFIMGAIGEFYGRANGWPIVKRSTLGFYVGAMVGVLLGDRVYKIFNAGHKDFEE
jgi:chromate transport protein ChrA